MADVSNIGINGTSYAVKDATAARRNVYYGTCTTAANTYIKVATVETFPLDSNNKPLVGTVVAIKYSNSNSYKTEGQTYQLNVNSTGDYPMYYNNAELATSTSANTLVAGYKNRNIFYMFNGTQWVWLTASYDSNTTYSNASLGQGYGTQSNSSAATAITVTLGSYALTTNGIVSVKFTYDVPASATLNINGKGAKAIYNKGAAITAGVIKAGDLATFVYNGTYYHLVAIDAWQDKQDAISDLAAIRSGAEAGATAIQSSDLATVATTGAYSDLIGTPTIPTKVSDLTNDAGYTTNTGTLTGVTFNGTSATVSSGVAAITATIPTVDTSITSGSTNAAQSGAVYTALAGKQATLVSGTNIKTVNNESLLGSGNLTIQGEKGDKGDTGNVTLTDGDLDSLTIYNGLDYETNDSEAVLSAYQGFVLNEKIEDGEVIVRSSEADLDVRDGNGNVIVEITGGHIKTKNFDSSDIDVEQDVMTGTTSADMDFRDENGNILVSCADGHIKTAEFDSRVACTHADTYIKSQTDELIASVGGGRAKRHLHILVIGNSYSHDSFMYLPFILKEYGIDITVGIYDRSSGSISYANTEYNSETAGDFELIDTSTDTAWSVIASQISPHSCVVYPVANNLGWTWDMIVLQQSSRASVQGDQYDSTTNVYNNVGNLLAKIMADVPYPFMLGWNINHTNDVDDGAYNYPLRVLERCKATCEAYPVDVVFPYGTAIFNAQENATLNALGDGGGLRYIDNSHLQEGLPCYIAALANVECLFRTFYPMFSVIGDTTVPDTDWASDKNIVGKHGSPVGVVNAYGEPLIENLKLAQQIAVIANLNKFKYKQY